MPPRILLDTWTFWQFWVPEVDRRRFLPADLQGTLSEYASGIISDAVRQGEVCASVLTFAGFHEHFLGKENKWREKLRDEVRIAIMDVDLEVAMSLPKIPSNGTAVEKLDRLTLDMRLIAATALRHNLTLISVTHAVQCEGLEYVYARAGRMEVGGR